MQKKNKIQKFFVAGVIIFLFVLGGCSNLLSKKNPTEFYNAGLEKLELKDYDGAMAEFDEAIKINSKFYESYIARGAVKEIRGDYEGAIKDYDTAIKLKPDSFEVYYNRGAAKKEFADKEKNIAKKIKYYESALKDFEKISELDPKNQIYFMKKQELEKILKKVRK
ncbi:MAG: tetratricopeptide repeat protein [Fusobacteriaceae bacterium]